MELKELIERSKSRPAMYCPAIAMEALRLRDELATADAFYKVVVAERDYERALNTGLLAVSQAQQAAIERLREYAVNWHDIAVNLAEALSFYADPDSYFGIAVMADRPCGEFADDVSEDETYGRHMPGAKARAALKLAEQKECDCGYDELMKELEETK